MSFLKPSRLNPGCIGVLRWSHRAPLDFELLAPPWLKQYTRHDFRHVC